jgi:hypothetical protein
MKKNSLVLGMLSIALVFGMVVTGCASKPVVYDSSIPVEQSCIIQLGLGIWKITKFDDVPVNWKGQGNNFGRAKSTQIPAGSHTLTGSLQVGTGGSVTANSASWSELYADNVSATYNFEAGHTYYIMGRRAPDKSDRVFIDVTDLAEGDT